MAPCSHFYFDYYQFFCPHGTEGHRGPHTAQAGVRLELPELSPEEASKVRGLQANIWTEYLYDMGLVEYMAWPRALALANGPGATATRGTINPSAAVPPWL